MSATPSRDQTSKIPNIRTLGEVINLYRDVMAREGFNELFPYGIMGKNLGDMRQAQSFRVRDDPDFIARSPYLNFINKGHALLRRKAIEVHNIMVNPEGCYWKEISKPFTTAADSSNTSLSLAQDAFDTYRSYLYVTSTETEFGEHTLNALRAALTFAKKVDVDKLSPATVWTMVNQFQAAYEVAVKHGIKDDHPQRKTLDAMDASLDVITKFTRHYLDNARALPTITLSLKDPVKDTPIEMTILNDQLEVNPRWATPAITALALFSGRGLIDKNHIPTSLKSILMGIGNANDITRLWQKFTDRVTEALKAEGYQPAEITPILEVNSLAIGRNEYQGLQWDAASSLQEMQFLNRLYSAVNPLNPSITDHKTEWPDADKNSVEEVRKIMQKSDRLLHVLSHMAGIPYNKDAKALAESLPQLSMLMDSMRQINDAVMQKLPGSDTTQVTAALAPMNIFLDARLAQTPTAMAEKIKNSSLSEAELEQFMNASIQWRDAMKDFLDAYPDQPKVDAVRTQIDHAVIEISRLLETSITNNRALVSSSRTASGR